METTSLNVFDTGPPAPVGVGTSAPTGAPEPPTTAPTPVRQVLEALQRGSMSFAEICANLPAWSPTRIAGSLAELAELALVGRVVAYFDPRNEARYKINPTNALDERGISSLFAEPLSHADYEAHLARIERDIEAMILAEVGRGTKSAKKIDAALRLPFGTAQRVLKSLRNRGILAAKNALVTQSGGEQEGAPDGYENENDEN